MILVTTIFCGIRWVAFFCVFESATRYVVMQMAIFLASSDFASWQDAVCNDDSCKWPPGLSNSMLQCCVLLVLSSCLPSAAELPERSVFETQ